MNSPLLQSLERQYTEIATLLPGAGRLDGWRRENLAAALEIGLPTQKWEAWRYSNLNTLRRSEYQLATVVAAPGVDVEAARKLLPQHDVKYRMVFINGGFSPELSSLADLPDGVALDAISQGATLPDPMIENEPGPFGHLNAALHADGFVLRIASDVALEDTIEIVSLALPQSEGAALTFHPRQYVEMAPGSRAQLIEWHIAAKGAGHFINLNSAINVAAGAHLAHVQIQNQDLSAIHIGNVTSSVADDASYNHFALNLGAAQSRNQIHVALNGPGAHCGLFGAYLLAGKQACDNATVIVHNACETISREVYKGVLDERSQAAFAGRITVQPDAQRIEGAQQSHALLLSDHAQINAKPELEIYADDVKCSHGSTVGELDADALFYLRSRGIPEREARNMLMQAFVYGVIEEMADERLRGHLQSAVASWLDLRLDSTS